LGLRLGFGLALLATTLRCSLSENFTQCQVDADCPATNATGQKLLCTPDHFCSVGTPAASLCTETYPATSPTNAIVVGVLTNIKNGSDSLPVQAFKQAIDEINALRLSTGDRQIALNLCEISANPDDPLKSMKILARERGAVAVLGPSSSAYVLAVAPEVIASQVPIMSQSASSPAISGLPPQGLFFRTVPADTLQGPILAAQLMAMVPSFDMITVSDSYGTGLQGAFFGATTRMPHLSVTYSESVGTPAAMVQALGTVANQIVNDTPTPNVVFAITNNLSAQVVQALLPLNTASKIIMADGAKNQELLDLLTGATPQMKTHLGRISGTAATVDVNNSTGTGAYNQLLATYQQKWKTAANVNNYIAYAYDGAYAIGLAIGAAGNDVTPASVSAMLLRLNGTTDHITVGATNYLMSKSKLAAGSGITLQGATGGIRFTPHGDRDSGLYEVWSIDTVGGVFKSVPAN
jgi:branched-chain amino acid transport system substrate-binding protein